MGRWEKKGAGVGSGLDGVECYLHTTSNMEDEVLMRVNCCTLIVVDILRETEREERGRRGKGEGEGGRREGDGGKQGEREGGVEGEGEGERRAKRWEGGKDGWEKFIRKRWREREREER